MRQNLRVVVLAYFMLNSSAIWADQNAKLSPQAMRTLMDSIVTVNASEYNVPGMAYAIVNRDSSIVLGDYGFCDLTNDTPLRAKDSQFMMGSLAKLITSVAVMQLVEQAKVELDKSVDQYIKSFKVPYPVTLRQLLTHTGGLEERVLGRVKLSSAEFLPLEVYLRRHLPDQVLTPGKFPAYSNHGMALAGLVVQEVSGLKYEAYVQKNIFQPLGMLNSTFVLDPDAQANLCIPYLIKNDQHVATRYEYVQTIPASMLISTAEDMSKFMRAMLFGSDILAPKPLETLQAQHYTPHPRLPGRALGFFERNHRGKRALVHGGTRNGFIGYTMLVPEDSLGVFVISNGGRSNYRTSTVFDFLNTMYPKQTISRTYDAASAENLNVYEGVYYSNRRNFSDFTKLILQGGWVDKIVVSANADTLQLLGRKFKMENEDQFNIADEATLDFPIAFGRNGSNRIVNLFLPGRSDSYTKLSWFERETFAFTVFITSLILFLIYFIAGIKQQVNGVVSLWSNPLAWGYQIWRWYYCLFNVIFLSSLIIGLAALGQDLQYGVPFVFHIIFSWTIIGLLTGLPMVSRFPSFFIGTSVPRKVGLLFFLVTILLYTWQLYSWNLLGFNF